MTIHFLKQKTIFVLWGGGMEKLTNEIQINLRPFLFNLFIVLFIQLFTSCQNPIDTGNFKLVANAGEDQTTIVGSYAIFDGSKSSGKIDWYEWEQDTVNNPQRVLLFSESYNYPQYVGFVKEGIYHFKLIGKEWCYTKQL